MTFKIVDRQPRDGHDDYESNRGSKARKSDDGFELARLEKPISVVYLCWVQCLHHLRLEAC